MRLNKLWFRIRYVCLMRRYRAWRHDRILTRMSKKFGNPDGEAF